MMAARTSLAILVLLVLSVLSAGAQATNRITLTIVVTNRAVTSNTLVVNASTRTWTNASTATTILTNLVSTATTATNLYNNIANFPYSGGIFPRWLSETSMSLVAPLGAALAASQSGDWAILTLSTQSGPLTFTALWPIENLPTATNRTNQASSLVGGLSQFSTNAFATNSSAGSNFLTKGASPLQRVDGPIQLSGQVGISISSQTNVGLYNATNRGYVVALTNGYWTNATFANPVMTNATNYGLGFSSPGPYPSSQQFAGGQVSAGYGMAIGEGSSAGTNSLAVGNLASAGHFAVAIGNGADASVGTNGVAIGQNTGLGASSNAVAIGQSAQVLDRHHGSVALGQSATTTTNLQVMLGSSSHTVVIPGLLAVTGTQTNTTFRGTNVVNARVDFTSRANTSLANGNNAGVILGTNTYIRLSGPSASFTINGIAAEQDGSWHICEFVNPVNSLIVADNSGTDPVAANRIRTGTGADVTFTNNPVVLQFIYNATDARWKIANWFR